MKHNNIFVPLLAATTFTALTTGLMIQALNPIPALAQSKKQVGVYAITGDGTLKPGMDGIQTLNATGLQLALMDANSKGYRLHSVVYNTVAGGYVVIVEY